MKSLNEYYKGRDFLKKINRLMKSFVKKTHQARKNLDSEKRSYYEKAQERTLKLSKAWRARKTKELARRKS